MTPEQIAKLSRLEGLFNLSTDTAGKVANELIGVLPELLDSVRALARLRERLERLRPLSEAATDAPWQQGSWHPDTITSPSRTVVDTSCSGMEGGGIESADDRAFVIAARNEIAAMLEDTKP